MYKILLIEDEALVREGLKQILEIRGYEVIDAKNGKEAIKLHKVHSPDLVITDIIMPEADGVEVILEIKRLDSRVKIIAMSGGGQIEAATHLSMVKRLGADKILSKPFATDELVNYIQQLLSEETPPAN